MKIAKYFWNVNTNSLKETIGILKNPRHPKFPEKMVILLSRCDKPKELFTLISKNAFAEDWPRIRAYWLKTARISDFRDWWQTIYEQILEGAGKKAIRPTGKSPASFSKIGRLVKDARIKKGFSQKELALRAGMKQPDISKIEEGRKNITTATLVRICKILNIKAIEL